MLLVDAHGARCLLRPAPRARRLAVQAIQQPLNQQQQQQPLYQQQPQQPPPPPPPQPPPPPPPQPPPPPPQQQQPLQQPRGGGSRALLPAVGDELEVECVRLGLGGVGVALWSATNWVLLVARALPGERLRARVTAVHKGYGEAVKLQTLRPHADAVQAPCPHYAEGCGGCTLQDLLYSSQLRLKAEQVAQQIVRVGAFPADQVAAAQLPAVAAPALHGFRNKLQFTFSNTRHVPAAGDAAGPAGGSTQRAPTLGLLRPGSATAVLPIGRCLLQGDAANLVLDVVRRTCEQRGLLPHDPDGDGAGVMRHLIVRSAYGGGSGSGSRPPDTGGSAGGGGDSSGGGSGSGAARHSERGGAEQQQQQQQQQRDASNEQLMVVLVTSEGCASARLQPLVEAVTAAVPQVVSVVHSVEARSDSSSSSRSSSRSSRSRQPPRAPGAAAAAGRSPAGGGGSDASGGRRARRALQVRSSAVLWGREALTQRLCGLDFGVSAHSFFQTNVAAAELLFEQVAAACDVSQADVLLDCFCGTGTIGLALARRVRQVVGLDISASSIADARANAARNGITNATFVCCDLSTFADQLTRGGDGVPAAAPGGAQAGRRGSSSVAGAAGGKGRKAHVSSGARNKGGAPRRGAEEAADPAAAAAAAAGGLLERPDVVVVDPARAGLGWPVVRYLLQSGARRVVYVSCNAATMARDLQRLCQPVADALPAFQLVSWRAVDMFPHSEHVEVVAVLDRARAAAAAAAG